MNSKDSVIKQLITTVVGECICTLLMLGIYAAVGRFSLSVLWGAIFGCAISCANFFALSITVSRAALKVQEGEEAAAKAKLLIQASSIVRLIVMAALYIVILKAKICDPLASILPLLFIRVGITVTEFFRKEGKKA